MFDTTTLEFCIDGKKYLFKIETFKIETLVPFSICRNRSTSNLFRKKTDFCWDRKQENC